MSIKEYSDKNKIVEKSLLAFLEDESSTDEYYQDLTNIIDKNKISTDKYELILFLHLISKISEYHHRDTSFINKLERILRNYAQDIKKNLTDFEIFNIFKDNKRILLFLFEEQIITINKQIVQKMIKKRPNIHSIFHLKSNHSLKKTGFQNMKKINVVIHAMNGLKKSLKNCPQIFMNYEKKVKMII